jgi:hypothetical protein
MATRESVDHQRSTMTVILVRAELVVQMTKHAAGSRDAAATAMSNFH